MRENKVVGFWMRFLGRLIDLVVVGGLVVLIGWLTTSQIPTEVQPDPNKVTTVLGFAKPYEFYVWALSTMSLFAINFILVPFLTKGRTFGMFVCRIRIVLPEKKAFLAILKREMLFSGTWIWSTFLLMTLVNHTLINQFALTDQSLNNDYTAGESARLAVLSVFASVPMFLMFGSAISIVVRKNKSGFHDSFSNTKTVWEKKFVEIKVDEVENISIQPMPVKNNSVEWI